MDTFQQLPDDVLTEIANAAYKKIALDITLPYGARVEDYPNRDDLLAADAECEAQNMEWLKMIVRSVLEATEEVQARG